MCICSNCHKEFNGSPSQACKARKGSNIFCSRECRLQFRGYSSREHLATCIECGKALSAAQRDACNKYCSQSCSAKHNNRTRAACSNGRATSITLKLKSMRNGFGVYSAEYISALSKEAQIELLPEYESWRSEQMRPAKLKTALRKAYAAGEPVPDKFLTSTFCIVCGKEFTKLRFSCNKTCSEACFHARLREAGQLAARKNKNTRRSRNEVMFANLCNSQFNVLTNEAIFNDWDADIILPDLRVAVLWNGKWHYEQFIDGCSLKQVQTRDAIKLLEIRKSGYTPYVIKDMGSADPKFVAEMFRVFMDFIMQRNTRDVYC